MWQDRAGQRRIDVPRGIFYSNAMVASGPDWKTAGLRRLLNAARHQRDGIRHGLVHDPAIRQVSIACWLFTAVALFMPVGAIEKLLLILPLLLVVILEYVNSAIEAVVDRVSTGIHPLSKIAKDYASVAVALSVLVVAISWGVILGSLAWRWLATGS